MMRISFFTLGCRLNQSETAVLEGLARDRGLQVVNFNLPADVTVINSCTVTERSDKDARKAIHRAVRINPAVRIAIIGCQAQVQKEKLLALPNVSWVVGTAKKMELLDIIMSGIDRRELNALSGSRPQTPDDRRLVIAPGIRRRVFSLPLTKEAGSRTRANLKIQDGCDHFCAYCEIPFARGRSRSRAFDNLMAEARALAAAGHKEIVLTGVNVAAYSERGNDLIEVVKSIETIAGIERLRISSIEDLHLSHELARFMRPPHKLCRFLHIPVQSGCDRILKRMGRKYSTKEFESLVHRLVRDVPGITIGTDVIVGFPGETDKDFENTQRFLSDLPVHYCHVFSYSRRNKARSCKFKGEVPEKVIFQRSRVLRALSDEKRKDFMQDLLGTSQRVLFEQIKNNFWFGHTDNYVTIKTSSELNLVNTFADVVPVKIEGHSLVARMCSRG